MLGCFKRQPAEDAAAIKVKNPLHKDLSTDDDADDGFVRMAADAAQFDAEAIDNFIDACAEGDHTALKELLKQGAPLCPPQPRLAPFTPLGPL